MMSGLPLAMVIGAPMAAAVLIAVRSPSEAAAGRWAVRASAAAVTGATVALLQTAMSTAPVVALELGNGYQVGLVANRATATIALLTTAVSLVVQSFATRSLRGDPRARRFFLLSCALTAATTLTALSVDGVGLVLGWLATSVTLTALLRHYKDWGEARRAARLTGRSFVVGDVAILGALGLAIASIGGIDLRVLDQVTNGLGNAPLGVDGVAQVSSLDAVAMLLVVAGLCRSALIPAHRWLPATLAAPTPVSALLHAGVVNGIGVLLIRFSPVVGSSSAAMPLAFVAGAGTAVFATAIMLARSDVKGALVWSTAGQMGFMTVQLAVGAFGAALFHLIGHAMYKAALFLGAGSSVSASARRRHLPTGAGAVGRTTRLMAAAVVPGAGLAVAFRLSGLSGSTAAKVLIGFFGWLTAARLVGGWLRSAQMSAAAVAATVTLGVGWPVVYVSAVTAFERFVGSSAPMNAPAAVTTPWLIGTIIAVTAAAAPMTLGPERFRQRWRRRVFTALLGWGVPTPDEAIAVAASRRRHRREESGASDSSAAMATRPPTRWSARA